MDDTKNTQTSTKPKQRKQVKFELLVEVEDDEVAKRLLKLVKSNKGTDWEIVKAKLIP